MPELPEVETIRRSLQRLVGKTIKNIKIRKPKIFQGDPGEVIGERILDVKRRGKILMIYLSSNKGLLIHLKLTGQLFWVPETKSKIKNQKSKIILDHPIPFAGAELPAKTTHVIFEIDGGRLFYNDLRQFGWIRVVKFDQLDQLVKLGIEPFDKEFTLEYLQRIFSRTSKPIKLVVMDQEKIAGIGNIYANEALFEAGIRPDTAAKQLDSQAIKQLRRAMIKVLKEGLKYGGSSAADEAYIKPDGSKGAYQEHFRVYQRDSQKCWKCGSVIKRISLGGRGTFFCPKCQIPV